MNDYKGKSVVITGAASGIGKALAIFFANQGAKLALVDWDTKKLAIASDEVKAKGAEVITSNFDVSNTKDMESFAKKVYTDYGTVDILFNNAGISDKGRLWDQEFGYIQMIYNANVLGVLNGIRTFVPSMIKEDKECWVVNVTSFAGLINMTNSPMYNATKHAATIISEVLNLQLEEIGSKVKSFTVLPGFVLTDIYKSNLKCEGKLIPEDVVAFTETEDFKARTKFTGEMFEKYGMPVEQAVEIIIKGLEADNFYIYTHPEQLEVFKLRLKHIMDGSRPTLQSILGDYDHL